MNNQEKIKNVFVLCTGRCGSVTFYEACKEINNYSSAHESRLKELSHSRIDYPEFHIEIDNRLSWFLGRLEIKYGSAPIYVHLYRNKDDVIKSYNRRWFHQGSIVRSYGRGIVRRQNQSIDITSDMVNCQLENIETFLSSKDKVIRIDIESPQEGFTSLWKLLGAEGDLDKALEHLHIAKNKTKTASTENPSLSYQTSEIDYTAEDLEESLVALQKSNTLLSTQIRNKDQAIKLKDASIASLKLINQQRKNRIERLTSSKSYMAIDSLKRNLRSVKRWPNLSIDLYNIATGQTNRSISVPVLKTKDAFLVASKIDDVSTAESFLRDKGSRSDLLALNLLKANHHRDLDNEWLSYTNKYLAQYNLNPISLSSGSGSRFSRLISTDHETIEEGPCISVIMPAYNSESSLKHSAESILNQSWKNLELIIINDCSTDRTEEVAIELAARDPRVTILNNRVNVGPYVSKNRGVDTATGKYITGHDADDWAFPQRLELQHSAMADNEVKACACSMLRVDATGQFVKFGKISSNSNDGANRLAYISSMFCASFFRQRLGYWDSVRYAADSEIIGRAKMILGESGFLKLWIPTMLCLDSSESLTNNPTTGISPTAGLSPTRAAYRASWRDWHHKIGNPNTPCLLEFPQNERMFPAPPDMLVPDSKIRDLLEVKS